MNAHQELVTRFKSSGFRLTPQREIVLAVLAGSEKHLAAEEILRRVRRAYPYLNKSVVYRNLDLLTQLGLVSQTNLGQGRVEYELHRHPHHHHLVCRQCHRTIQVPISLFDKLARELVTRYGFDADLDHFAIFGLCQKCRSNRAARTRRHSHIRD